MITGGDRAFKRFQFCPLALEEGLAVTHAVMSLEVRPLLPGHRALERGEVRQAAFLLGGRTHARSVMGGGRSA
jgi:hypothetical protein